MRHGLSGNKLNMKMSHRKATIRDIAKAVLLHQRISTTKARAKEARKLVEKLITLGKKGKLADKRRAFAVLCNHKLVSDLFNKIAPRFSKRQGGYTRMIPYANRKGDNAELVFLELTEKEEVIISKPKVKKSVKSDVKETKMEEKDDKSEVRKEEGKAGKDEDVEKSVIKEPKKSHGKHDAGTPHSQEKEKVSKKFVGGLRKMFQRKAPGQ